MKKENSKPLTLAQKAELDALTAMPEDQINTADIPEQRDWSGARRGLFAPNAKTVDAMKAARQGDIVTAGNSSKELLASLNARE